MKENSFNRVRRGMSRLLKAYLIPTIAGFFYYISGIVKSDQIAEELIMDVFLKIWLGWEHLTQKEHFNGESFTIHGVTTWAVGGNGISFVPSTLSFYNENNSDKIIAAFLLGATEATADPTLNKGVYILKIVSLLPGSLLNYVYKIGNLYAHLSVLQ